MLFMRCVSEHAMRWQQTGASVYDKEDLQEQGYERTESSATSYMVLVALVAVVGFIAVLAAWTSA
jgi:hypothetical protein